jgi:hypothetical protein
MLAGFLLGLVHDRRLLREAAVNLAIRWFARFGLTEPLPEHSSLTRIRQRWGAARFRRRQRLERAYKQHTAVCDQAGVIVDVEATTGELNEGGELVPADRARRGGDRHGRRGRQRRCRLRLCQGPRRTGTARHHGGHPAEG